MTPARIKESLRRILHLDETPHVLAKSFAVGVFVAFTPFMGFHTLIALTLAWALRLNKAVALTGTFVNNPWTIAFIFIGPTWMAALFLRKVGVEVPPLNYEALSGAFMAVMDRHSVMELAFWRELVSDFKPYINALLLGATVAGFVSACVSYVLCYYWIRLYRIEKARLLKKGAHD